MKMRLLAVLSLILTLHQAHAQGGLQLKKPAIGYVMAVNTSILGGGIYAQYRVQAFSPAALTNFTTNGFGPLDLQATRNNSMAARTWSDVSVAAIMLAPGIFSLTGKPKQQFLTYNLVYAQTILATAGQIALVKAFSLKARPYIYNPAVPIADKTQRKARFSFPSGHTAFSAAACYYFATTYSIYYPKSKWKRLVWACAAVLPAIPAYLRFAAGRHFVSDLAMGYFIGAANGIIVPLIFRIKNKKP